ncbi:MAG TPA: hypothetical protein VF800_30525 [Telluria sp.]|jgi:hypothetical protein
MTNENDSNVNFREMQPLLIVTPAAATLRAARRQTPVAAETPLKLTEKEMRLILLYRGTIDRFQDLSLSMSEKYAENFPRRVRPVLRLVDGGAA